jgi:hypothetical protein
MSESPEERMANNKVYSVDAFAAGIKSNHPEYQDIDNQELVGKMLEKYPQYRSQVDYTPVGGWAEEPVQTSKKKDSTELPSNGATTLTDSELPTEAPKRDAFKIIDKNPYELGRLWNRAIAGSETGKIAARSFYGGSIDFEELAYYNKVLNDNAPKADDWLAGDEENVVGSFLLDIVRTIPESLIGLVDASLSPEAAASAGAGAAAGAAVGTVFAPVTAAAGGAAGAAFAGSGMLTFGSTLLGKLSENGVDITNPKALEAAWNDTEFITPLAEESAVKAGIVGSFDALSAGLGGSVAKGIAKSGAKKVTAEIAEYAAEGSLGAAGEALGSLGAGDEINWRDVALEGLADPAAGISGRLVKSLTTSLEGKLDAEEQAMLDDFDKDPVQFEKKMNIFKVENAAVAKETKEQITELQGALKTAPKKQRAAILKEIQKLEKQRTQLQKQTFDLLDEMEPEMVEQLGTLSEEILELVESTKGEEVTESQRKAIEKVIEGKRKEIVELKKSVEQKAPVTETVDTPVAEEVVETPAEAAVETPVETPIEADVVKAPAVEEPVATAPVKSPKKKTTTKKATTKKEKAPKVEEVKVEQTPAVKETTPKAEVPEASEEAKKKLEAVAKVRAAAPKSRYSGVQSRMKSTERGYKTVIEKTDKRTGKVTSYEGDVFVNPKTGKVTHTVTEFVDGKKKGEAKSYKDVKSFRDAINKKIKAGAKEGEAFAREYDASPEGKSAAESARVVEFSEEKTKAPVKSKRVVEKVTYKRDGKVIELKIQVNGSNRQRQLPYATVTNVTEGSAPRRFETKQQYDKFRNEQLARRTDVKVETISETVMEKDAEGVFVKQEAPTEVKGVFKKPVPVKTGTTKTQRKRTTRKPFQPVVYAQVPQESRVYIVRDGNGNDRLFQKTIGRNGEFATYEVEEKTFAGGVKRYEIKEGAKGYDGQGQFLKALREETAPKKETKVAEPEVVTKTPEKKETTKPAKKEVKPPMSAPKKAEMEARQKRAEELRSMDKETVTLEDGKTYNVYADGTIVNKDIDKEINPTGVTGKKVLKELKAKTESKEFESKSSFSESKKQEAKKETEAKEGFTILETNEFKGKNSVGVDKATLLPKARAAVAVLKLIAPKATIRFVNNSAEFKSAMDKYDEAGSNPLVEERGRAFTNKITGELEIYINLENANPSVIAHEVFHVYFHKVANSNVELAEEMSQSISKALKKGTKQEKALAKRLDLFTSQYSENARPEEFLAELAGILSDNIEAITPTKVQEIVRIIKDLLYKSLKYIGIEDNIITDLFDTGISEREDAQTYIDFIRSFANSMNSYAFQYKNVYPTEETFAGPAYMSDMTSKSSLLDGRKESYETKVGTTDTTLSYEYLEDSVGRELLEKGYITTNHKLSEYENKAVVLHQPDRAFTGVIKYKSVAPDGTVREEVIAKGHGGMYYPMRFFEENYVWASTEVAAKGMADKLNASVKANGGKGYLVLVIGKQDKTFSSSVNINGVTSVVSSLTSLPEFGLSESEFLKMLKESVSESVGTGRNAKAKRIKKYLLQQTDIKKAMAAFQLLMNPEVTTFDQRKSILTKTNGKGFISKLNKHIKSKGTDTINAWNSLMGSESVFTKKGTMNITQSMSISKLEEGFLKMINEPVISGPQLTGMAHMVIEVEGEVEAFRTDRKSDSHHGSYPFAIRAKNDGAVKMRLFSQNERTFNGKSVYDANKGTEFTHIDTSSINNIEELIKAKTLNSKLSNTVLPPTSGTSESVILNPTAATKKALNKQVPINKKSRKNQEEQYEAIKKMTPEQFKEYFIKEKARSKAQSMSQNDISVFGRKFTYPQRNKITQDMLTKPFNEQGGQMTFIEYGKSEYLKEYVKAQEQIEKRGGKMESKSSLADEQSLIDEKINKNLNESEKPNLFSRLKSRKGLSDMFEALGGFAEEKGLVFTETQKKVRTFLESMNSQLSFSALAVRKHAARLRKLTKTPEALAEVRAYITEANPEAKQAIAERIEKMPKGDAIIATADSMRAMIDNLSQVFLDNPLFDSLPERAFKEVQSYKSKEGKTKYRVVNTKTGGIIDSDLTKAAAEKVADAPSIKDAIRANLGSYLHTSYRFFSSKEYKITDKAKRKAYEAEYEVAKMNEFKKLIKEGKTQEEALDILKQPATINRLIDEATESINKYVSEIEAMREDPDFFFTGLSANSIKIPKTALQQKKGIPEHIAELLGREKDPVNSFIDTAMVMHKTIFKTQMVKKISDAFGGDFVKDEVTDAEINSGNWKKVKDQYSPINGKYVKTEIFEMLQSKPLLQAENAVLNAYFKGLKVMRKSKVVWNLPTWRKNLTGGMFFIAANGVLNPAFLKDFKNRIDRTRKGEANPEIESLLKEMSELGLIGADVNAGLIDVNDAAMNVLFDEDFNGAEAHLKKVWTKVKNTDAKLAEKYAAIDDYTKLIIYRVERESFAKKLYGKDYASLTEAQQTKVRDEAGEFVKQNTPTFSRLPKWYINSFSKVPLGDFLGFKLESWRSITANLRNATADIKKSSDQSLSEVQRKEYLAAGRRRMMGSIATLGARAVVPVILTSMFLGDDDEEIAEDALAIRPDWMEGHSLIVKNISDDGVVSVYNYSMEDPYGEISDALMGDLTGFADFMSPNMFVKLAVHLTEGRDAYGRDLYDKSDPATAKFAKIMGYTTKSMIMPPSLVSTAKYQENQMLIRDYKYNLGQQFYFTAREYTKGKPYNELKGRARTNRLEALDDVKKMYDSVLRVAQHKGNASMMVNANKVLNRFNKIERAYIRGGFLIEE